MNHSDRGSLDARAAAETGVHDMLCFWDCVSEGLGVVSAFDEWTGAIVKANATD